MKNILIITPFFVPAYSYGGIVRVAYDHAIGLVKKGYNVTVVTTDVLDAQKRTEKLQEDIDGVIVIRFRNISNYMAKFHNLYLPRGMKSWLKSNIKNYDIVHIHDIYNLPTYWAGKYASTYGIKYFIQPHGTLAEVRIEARKSGIKRFILKKLSTVFDRATGFFALTHKEKEEIENVTQNTNISILPNGLDVDSFKDISAIDLHKTYNLPKTTKIITFLGRMQYIKGLDISLKILAKLDKSYTDWVFLIIGPDEGEEQNLKELSKKLGIHDKIIRYGVENTDKKFSLLKGSDLFMLTSRAEGFPMTVLEALVCNLPVFISEGCNLSIVNGVVGHVMDIDDINASTEKLYMLLQRYNQYKNNCKDFLKKYDINILVDKLINYYEK